MSRLKTDAIRNTSASADAITLATDGTCTAKITNRSNINLIKNGDMQISQRNGTSSISPTNNIFTVDRWQAVNDNASSKFTAQQVTEAPVGFHNSLKLTSSSAYTPASNEVFGVGQKIEGLDTNWLEFGSANAKSITISFHVRSSLTGTFGGSVLNSDMTRGYPFTYTISSADTWEKKTVTVAGATDGTWLTNNGIGIRVHFGLGANASRSGTANQWSSTQYTFFPTGATQVISTNAATLYLTGVKVEEGDVATDYPHISYGDELARCMRYFQRDGGGQYTGYGMGVITSNAGGIWTMPLPVPMRAAPTITNDGNVRLYDGSTNANVTAWNTNRSTVKNFWIEPQTASSSFTVGRAFLVGNNDTTDGYLNLSAEL